MTRRQMENQASSGCWSSLLERAVRVSATAHRTQTRKASGVPYFVHPVSVAMILLRAGFTSDVLLAAAILHDTLEDTDLTEEQLQADFPPEVCAIVAGASERKLDSAGNPRPWRDRKSEHLEHVRKADELTRAVVLADKLHNLHAMVTDLDRGEPLWHRFNAGKDDVLWYHSEMVAAALAGIQDEPPGERMVRLAAESRELISQLRSTACPDGSSSRQSLES